MSTLKHKIQKTTDDDISMNSDPDDYQEITQQDFDRAVKRNGLKPLSPKDKPGSKNGHSDDIRWQTALQNVSQETAVNSAKGTKNTWNLQAVVCLERVTDYAGLGAVWCKWRAAGGTHWNGGLKKMARGDSELLKQV